MNKNEVKEQTLEEAAKLISELGEYDRSLEPIRKNYFIKGAEWEAKKMEKYMKKAFYAGLQKANSSKNHNESWEEWFKQFNK